jgi:hypothetical protein
MGKLIPDAQLDAFLKTIADNCNKVVICSTQPTTYTEANATYKLGEIATTTGDGNGDFVISDGDTNGRKLRLLQQTGVPISATGSAQHIALLDTVNSKLLAVTTCTSQTVTNGNTATINAFDPVEVADAV